MNILKFSIAAFTFTSIIVFIQSANAQNIEAKAAANRTTLIYTYVQYNSDTCGAMAMPKFSIKSVKNGKIVGTKGSFKLPDGRCKGKRIKGVSFKYTPNRGFRGMDKARVILTMPRFTDDSGTTSRSLNFSIQVK